ncbi:MAG TPA: hypothetical protein EYQ27_04760 [Gemmatimonadetes bacterium]|nr:hypothetical protein [Gemmatimonadota bacterium]
MLILTLVTVGFVDALRKRDFALAFPTLVGCAMYASLGPLADGRFLVSCLPALLPLGGVALASRIKPNFGPDRLRPHPSQ